MTYIKGQITVKGANHGGKFCPYKHNFDSNLMMVSLKHPCDTGIVNSDGSINTNYLKEFILSTFVKYNDVYCLTQSRMNQSLKDFVSRDGDSKISWEMPSFSTVAQAEWDVFFDIYSDILTKNNEKAVTLETFLQFYFKPEILYQRVLTGELPVKI